jgi:hypothetical protein
MPHEATVIKGEIDDVEEAHRRPSKPFPFPAWRAG